MTSVTITSEKDCIGAIDGTHVHVKVPRVEATCYPRKRDWLTQNVFACCLFDMRFTCWKGSASDSRVLKSALTREDALRIPKGKYYLADVDDGLTRHGELDMVYDDAGSKLCTYVGGDAPNPEVETFGVVGEYEMGRRLQDEIVTRMWRDYNPQNMRAVNKSVHNWDKLDMLSATNRTTGSMSYSGRDMNKHIHRRLDTDASGEHRYPIESDDPTTPSRNVGQASSGSRKGKRKMKKKILAR